MGKPRYTYKDFITAQTRYTRGQFIGWSKQTGPFSVRYAGFDRGATMLWIPTYLLTKETKTAIAILEAEKESKDEQ